MPAAQEPYRPAALQRGKHARNGRGFCRRCSTGDTRSAGSHLPCGASRRASEREAGSHGALGKSAALGRVLCCAVCSGFGKRTIDAARRGAKLISMETCTSDHLLLRRQIITKSQPRSSPHYQRADRGLHTHLYLVAVYTRRALSLSRPRAAAGAALTDRAREGRPLVRWCAVDWEATHTREGPT